MSTSMTAMENANRDQDSTSSNSPTDSDAVTASSESKSDPSSKTPPLLTRSGTLLRYSQLGLCILAVLAIIHAMYFARAILFPIALAVVLFFLLAPVVRLLCRSHLIPESVAAAVVVLGITVAALMASFALSGPISQWFASAPSTFRLAEEKLRFMIEPVDKIDQATKKVTQIASNDEDVVKVAIKQPPITNYLLGATVSFLAGACVTIVLSYLLLAMGHRTLNSVVELIPNMENKRGFVSMIRDVERGISGYLLTITTINTILGIIIGTVLGLLGLPDPVLLGLMAGLLNFIPFAGCFVGAAVTFLIGVVYLDTPTQAVLGPLLYLAINILEGNVVTPLILGRSMKLNPAIVFVFIVFWGWVWGVGGILIAVPLLGMMKIACDHFDHLKPVSHILSG